MFNVSIDICALTRIRHRQTDAITQCVQYVERKYGNGFVFQRGDDVISIKSHRKLYRKRTMHVVEMVQLEKVMSEFVESLAENCSFASRRIRYKIN